MSAIWTLDRVSIVTGSFGAVLQRGVTLLLVATSISPRNATAQTLMAASWRRDGTLRSQARWFRS